MRGKTGNVAVIAFALVGCGICSVSLAIEPQELVVEAVKSQHEYDTGHEDGVPNASGSDHLDNIHIYPGRSQVGVLPESPYLERRRTPYRKRMERVNRMSSRHSGRMRVATPNHLRAVYPLTQEDHVMPARTPVIAATQDLGRLEPAAGGADEIAGTDKNKQGSDFQGDAAPAATDTANSSVAATEKHNTMPPPEVLIESSPPEIHRATAGESKNMKMVADGGVVAEEAVPTLSEIEQQTQEQILTPLEELAPSGGMSSPAGTETKKGLLALPGFDVPAEDFVVNDVAEDTEKSGNDDEGHDIVSPPAATIHLSGPRLELPPMMAESGKAEQSGEQVQAQAQAQQAGKTVGAKSVSNEFVAGTLPAEPEVKSMNGNELLTVLRPQNAAQQTEETTKLQGESVQMSEIESSSSNTSKKTPEASSANEKKDEEEIAAIDETALHKETKNKDRKLERIARDLKAISKDIGSVKETPEQRKVGTLQSQQAVSSETTEITKNNESAETVGKTVQKSEVVPVLSTDDAILGSIAKTIEADKRQKNEDILPIDVRHTRPTETLQADESDIKTHESLGISIEIKTPPPNVGYQLEQAYNALIAGHTEEAVEIYRDVLSINPNNTTALFGIATTYHRLGQLSRAREYYGRIIALDPRHPEAIGNYLSLLAEESPREALKQLSELEKHNPGYAPVVAQLAAIYEKMGDYDMALKKIKRAVNLSPENLSYLYNYAVLLDKDKKWDDAAKVYHQLIAASDRGQTIPGNVSAIQERLTFIMSNKDM